MIKQAKVYFDEIINQFIDCSKKLKLKACIFTLFVTLISGRTILSLIGGIPAAPLAPLPLNILRSTVSI